jgi:hypothetical protein
MTIKPQTVFRAQRAARDFTTLSNALLQDRRLSHETRGLLCELLSRPLDWEITVRGIIATGPSGRDKVYRMIAEAEACGYIRKGQERDEGGRMGRQFYIVSDAPEPLPEKPETVAPLPEKPDTAKPLTANQPQQIKESNKRQKEQNSTASSARSLGHVEDGEGIRGQTFAFSWAWVDAAADAEGVPSDQARKLAKVLALELVAAPAVGTGYFATFRRMLREHRLGTTRRPAPARQAEAKPHWRDVQREANDALAGAIARAKAREVALQ